MNDNDYKKTINNIFKNLNSIIDAHDSSRARPGFNDEFRLYSKVSQRAKKVLTTIAKYNPTRHLDEFSDLETNRFIKNLERINEVTDLIANDMGSLEQLDALDSLIDRVIGIYRTAITYLNESQIDVKIKNFQTEFDTQMVNLIEIRADIDAGISRINNINKDLSLTHKNIIGIAEEMRNDFQISTEKTNHISSLLSRSESAYANIDNIKETLSAASLSLKVLQDKNAIVNKDFDNFIHSAKSKVEVLLDKEEKISSLEGEITRNIEQSESLIGRATTAMTLTGTFRLSRSFKASYLIAKKSRDIWALASTVFAVISLAFVAFMLYEMYSFDYSILENSSTPALIMFAARFTMIPIVLGFFAFCAMQYVKQNNICEDYAHKKLLSETLVSFKDELSRSNNEDTLSFLGKILEVVLRSPLNLSDKKSHTKEINHINALVTQSNELGKNILDKVTPTEK
ncbi:hypothetical protein ACQZ19_07015 [Rahnella variigena]|uniref:hypothetical protein n=1 Tax=Rahnella variigena TaxID=574964 RepID=UPI003D2AEC94